MTPDEIIELAREAGFTDGMVSIVGIEGFANFAALVAAAEREACAKVADAERHNTEMLLSMPAQQMFTFSLPLRTSTPPLHRIALCG